MLHTRLCDVLGVESPILLVPMLPDFGVSPELAAAISEAGGFGIILGADQHPSVLKQEIQRVRELTQKPFGVGFLAPFYQEEDIAVCIEEKVAAISFYEGDLSDVEKIHAAGIKVIDVVSSVELASRAASAKVDVIIAQGLKTGPNDIAVDISIEEFVPHVVDAVLSVPVVAAIGIADARAVVAGFVLGAQGAALGVHSIVSPETIVSELVEGASNIITQGLNGLVSDVPPGSSTTGRG